MSRWIDTFDSHGYRSAWSNLVEIVENIKLDDETNTNAVQELARLKKVIKYISELLDSLDPELLPLSVWDNFNQQIGLCSQQVEAFESNRNEGHLNKANNHADNFLNYIRPYVVTPTSAGKAIQSALKESASIFEEFGSTFKKKAEDILEGIDSVRTESKSVLSEIDQAKQRIDEVEIEIFGGETSEGIQKSLIDLHTKAQEIYKNISSFNEELLVGDENEDSIQRQVGEILEEIEEKNSEIASLLNNSQSDLEDFDKYYADRTPVIRATLNVGFPYNRDNRRSRYETQALYRRADHCDIEVPRCRPVCT